MQEPAAPLLSLHYQSTQKPQHESWDPKASGAAAVAPAPRTLLASQGNTLPRGREGGFGHSWGWNYSELLPALSSP